MTGQALPPGGGGPRQVAAAINALLQGKLNSTGTVTLAPSAGSTILRNPLIGGASTILFMPVTANAAAAAAGLHVSARSKGEAVLTHAVSGAGDRSFGYAVIG